MVAYFSFVKKCTDRIEPQKTPILDDNFNLPLKNEISYFQKRKSENLLKYFEIVIVILKFHNNISEVFWSCTILELRVYGDFDPILVETLQVGKLQRIKHAWEFDVIETRGATVKSRCFHFGSKVFLMHVISHTD